MDKKLDFKKSLVRNTEQPLRKCKITAVGDSSSNKLKKDSTQKTNHAEKQSTKATSKQPHFETPELYSTLKIDKTLNHIIQPTKIKKSLETAEKLAVDEKVTRKVNFPYDQPIYKDLIPLTVKQTQSQPISSRNPMPQKDIEPILSNFIQPREVPNYYCLPNIKLENKGMLASSNNLRLYHIVKENL